MPKDELGLIAVMFIVSPVRMYTGGCYGLVIIKFVLYKISMCII